MSQPKIPETLNWLQVETALAIFEDLLGRLERKDESSDGAFLKWREENGIMAVRQFCAVAAPVFERIWRKLPEDDRDSVTWDWEFIPALVDAIDWKSAPYGGYPELDKSKLKKAAQELLDEESAELDYRHWKSAANSILHADYAITIDEAGIDESLLRGSYDQQETPQQFVQWFAEKRDLTHVKEWNGF